MPQFLALLFHSSVFTYSSPIGLVQVNQEFNWLLEEILGLENGVFYDILSSVSVD